MKKQGIILEKHKNHQTKKIYSNGILLKRYLFQPFSIKFESKMVNDINQHFCGGWSISGLDLSKTALLNRVLHGEKPMAIISEWEEVNLEPYIKLIDKEQFYVNKFKYKSSSSFNLIVATKGKLKDLFDLNVLYETYLENDISINIEPYKDKTLEDFFDDWDAQDDDSMIEFWVTGLILGYPIENTISIYKEHNR
ncbi:MAG TPA: hypothetical protein VIV55_10190 [Flavobacterium sp.]